MNTQKLMTVACAAALCCGAWAADEVKPVPTSSANAKSPALEQEEKENSPLDGLVAIEAGRILLFLLLLGRRLGVCG